MSTLVPSPGRAFALGLVALLAVACAKRTAPTSTVNSAPTAVTPASPTAAAAPSASVEASPTPAVTAPASFSAAPQAEAPAGAVRFTTGVEGCLAAADEADMARFPANTRAAPSGVELESDAGGVRVIHRLSHPCCLKGATRVTRDGGLLTVAEHLSGSPCRCRCSSALTTRIEVQSTDTEVSVRLEEAGRSSEVYRGPLPKAGGAPREPKLPPRIQGTPKTH